jgi:hypothetical protein
MGITRDITYPVIGFVGSYASASTWNRHTTGSTGHIVENATTYYSQVIDRLELGANFDTVDVALCLQSSWQSTMTGNSTPLAVTLLTWLQSGASSCCGDACTLAIPSSCGQFATKNFFTTVDSTDMTKASTWGVGQAPLQTSTGALNPGINVVRTYDLANASRYLRSAFAITRLNTSTCSDKLEGCWVNNVLVFREGDTVLPAVLQQFSTSTSTSTGG